MIFLLLVNVNSVIALDIVIIYQVNNQCEKYKFVKISNLPTLSTILLMSHKIQNLPILLQVLFKQKGDRI